MKWFRLWIDILDDPKLAVSVTDDETFRFLINLMAYARELNNAGKIDQPIEIISWRLRLEIPKINACLKHLKDLKIITISPEIRFLNWDKRQYLSDNSTERVKRFRIKNETLQKRKRNGGLCTETDTETDTETETELKSKPLPTKNAGDELFERFWKAYPKRIGKGVAEKSWKKIKPDEMLLQKMVVAIANSEETEQWQKEDGKYIPYPAKWLNGCLNPKE